MGLGFSKKGWDRECAVTQGGGDHDLCNGGGRGGLGYSKRRGEGMYLHQAGAP